MRGYYDMLMYRYATEMPPGFDGHPWLYMTTVFSLLLVNLLALEWLWRLMWSMRERRLGLRHPGTTLRVVLCCLLIGAVIRSGPDVLLLIRWPDIEPASRLWLQHLDSHLDSVSFIPFSLGWLFAWLGGPMIVYQLGRDPLPLHLWPTRDQLHRPIKIGLGVLVISACLTFIP